MKFKIFSLFIIVVVGLSYYFLSIKKKIAIYNDGYDNVTLAMKKKEIIQKLGTPDKVVNVPVYFWGEKDIDKKSFQNFKQTIIYKVDTFYLDIIWKFSLDAQESVIGKHRYD